LDFRFREVASRERCLLSASCLKVSDFCGLGFLAGGRRAFAGALSAIGRADDARNGCVAIGADVVRLTIGIKRRIDIEVPQACVP